MVRAKGRLMGSALPPVGVLVIREPLLVGQKALDPQPLCPCTRDEVIVEARLARARPRVARLAADRPPADKGDAFTLGLLTRRSPDRRSPVVMETAWSGRPDGRPDRGSFRWSRCQVPRPRVVSVVGGPWVRYIRCPPCRPRVR
jgi:hypothetical protein